MKLMCTAHKGKKYIEFWLTIGFILKVCLAGLQSINNDN